MGSEYSSSQYVMDIRRAGFILVRPSRPFVIREIAGIGREKKRKKEFAHLLGTPNTLADFVAVLKPF